MLIWIQWILAASSLLLQAQEPIVVQQAANWTSVIMAAIAIIPASITGIISGMALMQTRRNATVAAQTAVAVTSNLEKTDTVINKATEIHTLTNSNLSKVQQQLEVANQKIEGFHKAQAESDKRMASMETLISSLVPTQGQQSPSQNNSDKLDRLTSQVTSMQQGNPPIPVVDEAVLEKLTVIADKTDKKLDTIQESADVAAQETAKKKKRDN